MNVLWTQEFHQSRDVLLPLYQQPLEKTVVAHDANSAVVYWPSVWNHSTWGASSNPTLVTIKAPLVS